MYNKLTGMYWSQASHDMKSEKDYKWTMDKYKFKYCPKKQEQEKYNKLCLSIRNVGVLFINHCFSTKRVFIYIKALSI